MANDLRLQVIMDLANKASAPLRNISASSADAAKALKAARDQLKQLNAQQAAVDGFTKQQTAYKASSDKLKVLQQNLDVLRQTQGSHSKAVQAAEKAMAKQTTEVDRQKNALFSLRARLNELGIGKVSDAQARLKTETAAATAAFEQQRAKLKQLAEQQKKLDDLKARHGKDMMHIGMLAGAGVGMQAAGRGMAQPVLASVGAYAQQESATSQLSSAMMLADGSVSAEFKQINELAMRLGDRLPGTTADFIEMMTMLRRQGLSAQSILGGTGEAAAYLGVQLKMPTVAAAEFAAKMQDATRTTEADMMALMDTIQRTYYLGVDSNNMLQGFTKVGPAMSILHQEGLKAANTLAPLLVMMDQTGMAGEAAGNALRKIFQGGLDLKKLEKANKIAAKEGFKLNFVDKEGKFAGLDNLFAQLQKIKGIKADTKRITLIKTLFGDDAENLQVLNTLMEKGLDGYNEIAAKMRDQADLRKRVDGELKTLANLWDAATGSFTNVLASIGKTIEPQAKELVDWLGEIANKSRAWIEENPRLVSTLVMIVGVLAVASFALGTLAVSLAAVLGPMALLKFMASYLGLKFNLWGTAISVVTKSFSLLRVGMQFLIAHPILLVIAAIAAGAYLIYKNWDSIVAFFSGIWTSIKTSAQQTWDDITAYFASLWGRIVATVFNLKEKFITIGGQLMDGLINGITSRLAAVKDTVVQAAGSISDWFKEKLGIHSPSRVFMDAGLNIGEGAAIGIERSLGLVRTASAGLAAATAIGMPGLALADTAPALPALKVPAIQVPALPALKAPAIQAPALPALKAPAIQAPALEPLRLDTRPPLSAAGAAAPMAGTSNIQITINAAPGMDPQAIARAVSAELERRDRAQGARRRSSLSDIA